MCLIDCLNNNLASALLDLLRLASEIIIPIKIDRRLLGILIDFLSKAVKRGEPTVEDRLVP